MATISQKLFRPVFLPSSPPGLWFSCGSWYIIMIQYIFCEFHEIIVLCLSALLSFSRSCHRDSSSLLNFSLHSTYFPHTNCLHVLSHHIHKCLCSPSLPPALKPHPEHPSSNISTGPLLHMCKQSQSGLSNFVSKTSDLRFPSDVLVTNPVHLVTPKQNLNNFDCLTYMSAFVFW